MPEARAITADGDVILLVPMASTAARSAAYAQDDDVAVVMEITDVAPVSVPHRIRGRAWLAGWLTAVRSQERAACAQLIADRHPEGPSPEGAAWMLVRLEVGEAYVDDLWGAENVEPEEFAAAAPDPLVRHEAELLQHLDSAHSDQLRGLCSLLGDDGPDGPEGLCGSVERVVPLALDRHGMRLRFCEQGGPGQQRGRCFDARFEFPEPVRDVSQLRRAMHALFEAAESER